MKTSISLAVLAAFLICGGCQSNQNHVSNNSPQPGQSPKYTVTIESIPNDRLSATSREGDKPDAVYSSNIIAVYVNEVGRTNRSITNATSLNAPEKN
ncbi:MAG TPA: hypothetical protein VH597_06525 [Verrucomicrobiae bacterium]|nr:hypothetical protein [Verrucomicrobiae bacterium]